MRVVYKCKCMKDEAGIEVADREPGEDIVDWMDKVRGKMTADHVNRSPLCMISAVEYCKIPLGSDEEPIGVMATRH